MIIRVIAIMAAAFLLTGCGKKTESPSTVAQPEVQPAPVQKNTAAPVQKNTAAPVQISGSVTNNGGQPLYAPSVVPADQRSVSGPPNLQAMNTALGIWVTEHGKMPKDFEEWAASPNIAYPPPPAGKKYAFDKKWRIVLVNTTK